MTTDAIWRLEQNELLMQHLDKMGKWDLERLRSCFEWEYKNHPENKADIDNIIFHIDKLLESK